MCEALGLNWKTVYNRMQFHISNVISLSVLNSELITTHIDAQISNGLRCNLKGLFIYILLAFLHSFPPAHLGKCNKTFL